MNITPQVLKGLLPAQPVKTYAAVGMCIYCGSNKKLSDEHVIPLGLGGRLILPEASCDACSALTSAFEGTCQRTMFGPLRMLYDLPTRRKKGRPTTLPLKVKYGPHDEDWTTIQVAREDTPFLVLLPHFSMPVLLGGADVAAERGPVANTFWIRGASASAGFFDHLDDLIAKLKVHSIFPVGKAQVPEFCLMLAKVAHAFAIAELGSGQFEPLLLDVIRRRELTHRSALIGGLSHSEPPSGQLHEMSLYSVSHDDSNLLAVRIRLLARLGTPTYHVVAGRRPSPGLAHLSRG